MFAALGGSMIYMTGDRDTLKDLRLKEGYEGTLSYYEIQFALNNPHICAKYPNY